MRSIDDTVSSMVDEEGVGNRRSISVVREEEK